jgi:hypothetical protein
VVCKLYPLGTCKYGDTCLFKHVMPTLNIDGTVGAAGAGVSTSAVGGQTVGGVGYASPSQFPQTHQIAQGQGSLYALDDPFVVDGA